MSRDPKLYIDGPNFYAYCLSNPILHTDSLGEGAEWHHLLTQKHRAFFENVGLVIDEAEFGYILDWTNHRGSGQSLESAGWGKDWDKWIANNPNATKGEITNQLSRMKRDPKYKEILKLGTPATMSHKKWKSAVEKLKRKVAKAIPDGKKVKRAIKGVPIAGTIVTAITYADDVEEKGFNDASANAIYDATPILGTIKFIDECFIRGVDWYPNKKGGSDSDDENPKKP